MGKFDFVDRNNTYCTQWDFKKDRFNNDLVLPFSISDMDIRMAENIVNKLKSHLDTGVLGYSRWAHDEFFKSITAWYELQFKFAIQSNWITYSPTVTHSLCVIFELLQSKNVLVLTPCYDGFFKVLDKKYNAVESKMILVQNHYELNKTDLEVKIKDVDTLLFCNPHNPIGKAYNEDELDYLVSLCKKNNVFIVSDEIHMDFVYEKNHIPILKIAQKYDYLEKTMISTSATKSFNFPSLNFSYNLIPSQELNEAFKEHLRHDGLSSCNVLGLVATMEAYKNKAWLEALKIHLLNNLVYTREQLNDTNLIVREVDATYLVWIDATYYQDNFDSLIDIMHNKEYVGIMVSDIYKEKFHLRINIGCDFAKLEEGLKRLKNSIARLK